MVSDSQFKTRLYGASDLGLVASFVNSVGEYEHSATVRSPAYYEWIALRRPRADKVGPFIVEDASGIVGFVACRETGEVLDLAVSPQTDIAVVTRMLLDAAEQGCSQFGAPRVLVNVASVRRDMQSIMAELGYVSEVNKSLHISVDNAPVLLEALLKGVEHSVPPFNLSLRSSYSYLNWDMHVDGQRVRSDQRVAAALNVEMDTLVLSRILFGRRSAFQAWMRGGIRVLPRLGTRQVLRLFSSLRDTEPRSFSRSQIL